MPSLMTIDADLAPLRAAFDGVVSDLQKLVNDASRVTAEAIVREAKSRLQRELKGTSVATKSRPDLGQGLTLAGIHAQPAYDDNGWVVLSDREPYPNVPLFVEKGTHVGRRHNFARTEAEPFFYVSIQLEVGAHEQRIEEAMRQAAQDSGLGE